MNLPPSPRRCQHTPASTGQARDPQPSCCWCFAPWLGLLWLVCACTRPTQRRNSSEGVLALPLSARLRPPIRPVAGGNEASNWPMYRGTRMSIVRRRLYDASNSRPCASRAEQSPEKHVARDFCRPFCRMAYQATCQSQSSQSHAREPIPLIQRTPARPPHPSGAKAPPPPALIPLVYVSRIGCIQS